ncbi:hypothetical protein [Chondromyces crocatus]|uniref:Uncharacterized protein n=1 Tax=Chondromyces crocatus TaxID=52 RepID=A0A0K1ELR9_CHOCO|nr:hypothetical protein [Chondromyces crocatus]AKT41597.1 uncharacterized protein CMC5_058040 [Chondromyces crocatus]
MVRGAGLLRRRVVPVLCTGTLLLCGCPGTLPLEKEEYLTGGAGGGGEGGAGGAGGSQGEGGAGATGEGGAGGAS